MSDARRRYSLAHLTWLSYTPPELVALAARTGYAFAGLRLMPASPGGAAYPLMHEPALLKETLARIADSGVKIFDLEIVRLDAGTRVDDFMPFLETGGKLGARALLVASDDPEPARLIENFARLCDAARPFGLSCDLEAMPWTKVPDLKTALRIVAGANRPNGGVLVDALHFARSASTLADVDAIPRSHFHYAQICDAPGPTPTTTEGLIHTARNERLLPGEGIIDCAVLFDHLPFDLPLSLEIPTQTRAHLGADEWAKRCLAAAKAVSQKRQ